MSDVELRGAPETKAIIPVSSKSSAPMSQAAAAAVIAFTR
jgi:hypothetical protein